MSPETQTPDLLAEARAVILSALRDEGPLGLPEMPRQWPVTRPMISLLLVELLRAGLVAPVPGGRIPGRTAYALTAEGRVAADLGADGVIRLPHHDDAGRASA